MFRYNKEVCWQYAAVHPASAISCELTLSSGSIHLLHMQVCNTSKWHNRGVFIAGLFKSYLLLIYIVLKIDEVVCRFSSTLKCLELTYGLFDVVYYNCSICFKRMFIN